MTLKVMFFSVFEFESSFSEKKKNNYRKHERHDMQQMGTKIIYYSFYFSACHGNPLEKRGTHIYETKITLVAMMQRMDRQRKRRKKVK